MILSRPILAARHLSCRIMITRRRAAAAMLNPATAPAALDNFLEQLQKWKEDHPDKFDQISASIAMLSVSHFAVGQKLPEDQRQQAVATAAVIFKHFDSQPYGQSLSMDDHAISNVFWACARLKLRPDDIQQGSQDRLALRFKALIGQTTLHSISSVLWSCSTLRINPLKGELLEALVDGIERTLSQKAFDPTTQMQSLARIMHAFANMQLHVHPSIAELILRHIYEGLAKGTDEPEELSNIVWACASLGYSPPTYMLQQFIQSHSNSRKPMVTQNKLMFIWGLAVLGGLTMECFQRVIERLPKTFEYGSTQQQLHIALQALRPHDTESAAHQDWLQVAHRVQQQWPLHQLVMKQTPFETEIYFTLLKMGYQALFGHASEDGLHAIDIALLPQGNLPCKVAVEADGGFHFLHEDCRLDNTVQPATRPDGKRLYRNAVLRQQGWMVVAVPWYEWPQADYRERAKYLQKRIQEAVAEYLQTSKSST